MNIQLQTNYKLAKYYVNLQYNRFPEKLQPLFFVVSQKGKESRRWQNRQRHNSASVIQHHFGYKSAFFQAAARSSAVFCQFYNDPGTIAMEPIGEFCGVLGIVSSVRTLTVRGITADDIQVAAIDLNGKTDRHILPPDSRRLIHASENTGTATKVMQAIMEHQRTAILFPYQTVA